MTLHERDELTPEPPRPWRRGPRLAAVTLWCGFLSATLVTFVLLVMAPTVCGAALIDGVGLGALTRWFLMCWAAALPPIAFAMSLVPAPPSDPAR